MKKIVLSLLFLLPSLFIVAQQVPRSMVALEIGTGTWCGYCPGAAMGADDLLENGKYVAVMENHNGDSYANTYSNARNTYYNITGFPTAVFDGLLKVVGGNHSQSMYPSYLPKYNTRINTLANLILSMEITHTGLDYTAVVTINKVANISATDLKLHFFITQSHIQQNWQGQTHLEHVTRKMVPDKDGTTFSFDSLGAKVITLNFTMASTWPIADCEFIAFVQSQSSKEVFNCIKQGAIDLTPEFSASATQIDPNQSVTFTNETTGGYINTPESYQWLFPGGTPGSSTDSMPSVTYNYGGTYDVTLIVNRGGQLDTLVKQGFIYVTPGVGIEEKSDLRISAYPNPTKGNFTIEMNAPKTMVANLEIINNLGNVVYRENEITINGKFLKHLHLTDLNAGIYFIRLENNTLKTGQKIVIN